MFGNGLDEDLRTLKEQDALHKVEREAIRILWITGMIPVEEYRQLRKSKLGIDHGSSASSAMTIMCAGDLKTSFTGKTVVDQYIESGTTALIFSFLNLLATDDRILSKMKEFQLLLLHQRNWYDRLSGFFKQSERRKQFLGSRFKRISCNRVVGG